MVRAAGLQPAWSFANSNGFGSIGRPAECNSAIQQIATLRYSAGSSIPLAYQESPQNWFKNVAAGVPTAVKVGILPSGKTILWAETLHFTKLIARRRFCRRAGRASSTSAKMADATFFRNHLHAKRAPKLPGR